MTPATPLDCVLGLFRAIEAGGGAAALRPFLAEDYVLTEAPHLLGPAGSTRTLEQVLDGAEQSGEIVSGQRFEVQRSTCEGGRVVVEAEWSATVIMDLPYWDEGDTIRARTASVFEVRDGRIVSQHSYDCYYPPRQV
jgi:ketosteroid isomerase-like protein